MSNAVDLAAKLNATTAGNLVRNGVSHVGRYLSRTAWKGLDPAEVSAIKAAGLQIFSIYETNPTYAGYFCPAKGESDALDAVSLAQAIGQPQGSAIYFTVDYNAQPADFPLILSYFQTIKQKLAGYQLGCYGSYSVLNYLHANGIGDYYFQTIAWSGGQRCPFLNIYQYQCDKPFAGLQVDFDNFEKPDVGAWGGQSAKVELASQPVAKPVQVVKVLVPTDIREQPSHTSAFVRNANPGEIFNVWEVQGAFHMVIADVPSGKTGWIDDAQGQNLYWIDNPALNGQIVYYVVKPGDNLTAIANANSTTIAQLKAWNGIKDENKIMAGQKIRVK